VNITYNLVSILIIANTVSGMEIDGEPPAGTAGTEDTTGSSGPVNTNTSRPAPQNLDLGTVYKQCSTSRSAALTLSVTTISDGECVFSSGKAPTIGSLDWHGDQDTLRTFYGARVNKNGRAVNESISSSFDPRNLFCIGCSNPHHILGGKKPAILVFTDQNFVPFLSGDSENCIAIVRLEDPSLNELADLAGEILDRYNLPSDAVLLFGSGSHLSRVGAAQYAADWINLSNRCSQKWPKAVTVPLIPIIRTESPGSLARDISLISAGSRECTLVASQECWRHGNTYFSLPSQSVPRQCRRRFANYRYRITRR
jgi:hypothetical protein